MAGVSGKAFVGTHSNHNHTATSYGPTTTSLQHLLSRYSSKQLTLCAHFCTPAGYIQRITGIRHPAEEAAIKAAAAALSTGGPSAGHLGTVSEEGVATFAKEDATVKTDLSGGYSQLTVGMSGAMSGMTTAMSGMTTAVSAGYASAVSKGAIDAHSPSVIHATATFRGSSAASLALDRHASVHSIAGPYRMRTGLRCVQEETHKRSWKGVALSVVVRTMYVVVTTAGVQHRSQSGRIHQS